MPAISEARIMILATDGFEQSELEVPLHSLMEAGASVEVVSPDGGEICGWEKKNWGTPVASDRKLGDVAVEEYDALVLPGGQINPDVLRTNEAAVSFIRDFHASGKTLAAICHAPWLLIEAGVIEGRRATSYHSIRTDMENAGALWEDAETVRDGNIITARKPDDLEAFVAAVIEAVASSGERRTAAE